MKINLPSTWTQKKIQALLFLTFIHSLTNTESGSRLSACLSSGPYNSKDLYNRVIAFASNVPNKELFCCDVSSTAQTCFAMSPNCPYYFFNLGQCNRVGQSVFCILGGSGWNMFPGGLCGGILGETPVITNSSVGSCPSLNIVGNTISGPRTFSDFTWMCCDNTNCTVPANVPINGNSALTNCATGQYSMMCFNDNGGWSCTGSASVNIANIYQPMGDCALQVALPSSSTTGLTTTTYTSGGTVITLTLTKSSGGVSTSSPNNPSSPNNDNGSSSKKSDNKTKSIAIAGLVIALLALVWGCIFFGILAGESSPSPNPQPVHEPRNPTIINNYDVTIFNTLRDTVNNLQNTIDRQAIELRAMRRQIMN